MYKFTLAIVSLLFLFATPAGAAGSNDQKWVVTQLSGDARVVRPGLQPASVSVRTQLSAGDKLLTGPTGRATLVKGQDYIVVAPRSELRVPTGAQPTGFTRVIQTLGTLLFKVQHTGVPHFAVDTPMLAAVVKGTTFTVTVDQQRSAIQVTQGVVQVTANDGGMSRLVAGGRTVYVNHGSPKLLLDADEPLPSSATPASTSVTVSSASDLPLAVIGTLTNGLVRADLTAMSVPVAVSIAAPTVAIADATPTNVAQPANTNTTVATTTPITTIVTSPTVTTAVSTAVTPTSTLLTTAPSVTTTPITTATTTLAPVTSTVTSVTTAVTTAVPTVTTSLVTSPTLSTTTSTVTVSSVSTPTVTIPSTSTTTIVPISTPTVTVPSISTPTVTTVSPIALPTLSL